MKRQTTTLKLSQIKTPSSALFEQIPEDTKQEVKRAAFKLLKKLMKARQAGCMIFSLENTPSNAADYVLMVWTMDTAIYNAARLGIAIPLLVADVNTDVIPAKELQTAESFLSKYCQD